MSEELMAGLFRILRSCAPSDEPPEATLECEPGTIGRAKLQQARIQGINRVSVCAQSFDDSILRAIGRRHTNEQSMRLLDDALGAGIKNLHLDLMYGLPGQTHQEWERTLRVASTLPINHISTYKLYIFKHGRLNRQGHPRGLEELECDTARTRAMHSSINEILGGCGFKQYTLTEYGRGGYGSEYIKSCFDGGNLLPLGPGAFGRCGNEVWENSPYVQRYSSHADANTTGALKLSSVEALKRDVILGLWLLRANLEQLAATHSVNIRPELFGLLDELCSEGFINYSDGAISLDVHQRFGAGQVMKRLADLSSDQWGTSRSSDQQLHYSNLPDQDLRRDHVTRLDQLIRVARRDLDLFNALQKNPGGTLQKLGYDTSEAHVWALLEAIQGKQSSSCDATIAEVRQMWSDVRQEHARQ